MCGYRQLFIIKSSLSGGSIATLDLFELSISERAIDLGNHDQRVIATREIAIEVAERFLEKHIRLIERPE